MFELTKHRKRYREMDEHVRGLFDRLDDEELNQLILDAVDAYEEGGNDTVLDVWHNGLGGELLLHIIAWGVGNERMIRTEADLKKLNQLKAEGN